MSQKTSKETVQSQFQGETHDQEVDERTRSESETGDEQSRQHRCPECESTNIATDSGEIVCLECGIVLGDAIDRGAEWRSFNQQEREEKSRVGAPLTETLHDKGLSTQIDWRDRDGYGNQLSERKRRQFKRLRKWHRRARTGNAGERNLKSALTEINRMAAALDIPDDVREVASVMYRRAINEDLIRGRSIEGVATSTLYAACRQDGIARTLDEMTQVSRIEKLEISRTYTYIAEELNLEMAPPDPKEYLPRFASKLDLNHETQEKASKILDAAIEQDLHTGKSPPAFTAAALYAAGLVSGERPTQEDVGEAANVSEVTIRNRYKEQLEAAGLNMA